MTLFDRLCEEEKIIICSTWDETREQVEECREESETNEDNSSSHHDGFLRFFEKSEVCCEDKQCPRKYKEEKSKI